MAMAVCQLAASVEDQLVISLPRRPRPLLVLRRLFLVAAGMPRTPTLAEIAQRILRTRTYLLRKQHATGFFLQQDKQKAIPASSPWSSIRPSSIQDATE